MFDGGVRVTFKSSTIASSPVSSAHQTLKRSFKLVDTIALTFSFISPIVALYTIFGLAITSSGGAAWWGFPIALGLQFTVALVFAEMVSIWPLAGGVYQWARAIRGAKFGWFAGWIYLWTLIAGLATVTYGGGKYLGALLGVEHPSSIQSALLAAAIVLVTTTVNSAGQRFMKLVVDASIIAEIIGSGGLGSWLLLFGRKNSVSVIFDSFGTAHGTFILCSASFAATMALVSFSFFGFESAGSIAEEVEDVRKTAPRAILLALVGVGMVVMFSAFALLLAVPDLGAVVAGRVSDPVIATLTAAFGPRIVTPFIALFLVGFIAAAVAIQAGASRVLFGLARDDGLPWASFLKRLSGRDALPINAVATVGITTTLLFSISNDNVYQILIAYCAGGFFLSFLLPTAAALIERIRGRWPARLFSLRGWGLPVNTLAVAWLFLGMVNVGWPRQPGVPWYINWAVPFGMGIIIGLGYVVYFFLIRIKSAAFAGNPRAAE
jgi:amino acid transporter